MRTPHRRLALAVVAMGVAASMMHHASLAGSLTTLAAAPAASWKKLTPGVSPSARAAMAMAYDPVSQRVVLFGGYDDLIYLDETWTFDGATWRMETPPLSPPPRAPAREQSPGAIGMRRVSTG